MPKWRATLPFPSLAEVDRAVDGRRSRKPAWAYAATGSVAKGALAAAAIFVLTSSAFAQAQKRDALVLQSLQPHSVRTLLRDPDPTEASKPKVAVESRPRAICLGNSTPAEASIDACSTLIQASGRRWELVAPAYNRRAEAHRLHGDSDSAIADFDRAIKLDPRKIGEFIGRGLAHLEKREFDLAIGDFNRAIKLNPRHAGAILNSGHAYRAMGDLKRALLDYALLIRINPKDAQALYHRAIAYKELRDYDRSVDDFNRMIQLDGDNVLGYYNRGLVYYEMHRYELAIRDFDQAINVKPDYALAFNVRGLAYAATARPAFDPGPPPGRVADRGFAEAFLNRAEIYHSTRSYHRALADYSEAIRLNPTDAYSLYSRGLIKRAMGNEAEAKTDIAKAKEIEPEIGP